jgi:hypothetical protein
MGWSNALSLDASRRLFTCELWTEAPDDVPTMDASKNVGSAVLDADEGEVTFRTYDPVYGISAVDVYLGEQDVPTIDAKSAGEEGHYPFAVSPQSFPDRAKFEPPVASAVVELTPNLRAIGTTYMIAHAFLCPAALGSRDSTTTFKEQARPLMRTTRGMQEPKLASSTKRKLQGMLMTTPSEGPKPTDVRGVSRLNGGRGRVDSAAFEAPQTDWNGAAVHPSSSFFDFGSDFGKDSTRKLQTSTSTISGTTASFAGPPNSWSCSSGCANGCDSR